MPLLNITNSFNAYDVVTINNGVATLLDISTTQSGIVGIVISNEFIATDEEIQLDTRQWNEGDKLYCGADSRLTSVQPTNAVFIQVIGYVIKSNALGKLFIYATNYQYMSSQFISTIQFGQGNLDAFSRLRVSQPQTLFDSKQLSDNGALFWDDQQISGSGTSSTYNTNQASTTIAVGNTTAGVRVRQTFRRFNYQPGKSQLVILTGVFGASETGITKRMGLFDTNNGVFFEVAPTGLSVVVRTYTSGSPVETRIAQADWNLDKMNGTGASGITLDLTKTNIFFIDFEWLGVGRIRYGVNIDGIPYYVHEINNANNKTVVYMSTPNLPLRYEIRNDGTGAASSLVHICTTVMSEGGLAETGFPFGVSRGATGLTTFNNTNIFPLFALRLNSSYLGSTIRLLDFTINCTSTAAFNYYLLLNPTVTGTAFSFGAVTNSSLDADFATTNATTVSGGTILYTGAAQQTNDGGKNVILQSDFSFGSSIAGVSDVVVMGVQRVTGTTETFFGSLNWRDLK